MYTQSNRRFSRGPRNHTGRSHGGYSGYRSRGNYRKSNGKPKTLFGQDVSLFIKKASTSNSESQFIPTHVDFSAFPLTSVLQRNIQKLGYTSPTPIQDQAIDPLLQGQDVIGLASTGTGKTAAFLIPIIERIYQDEHNRAIIVAPTRELALQIESQAKNLSRDLRIYSTSVIGGTNIRRQIHELRRFPHIVIATPGRLKDLIERHAIALSDFSIFVLDEVDMMVDIGFISDIKYFVSLLPQKRQSLFFSATISPKVREILQSFVRDAVTISVKKSETSDNVDQDVIRVSHKGEKVQKLQELLKSPGFDKVLIFGRTKHGIEKLHIELTQKGFKTGSLHGNKNQSQRKR
jgi:superfamily II DNA/RNA helicase